jgi:hypothetical protein
MAEKGFTPVQIFPLFRNLSLSAGDSGTSDVQDLRYSAQQGNFALAHSVAAGTAGTAGTTIFTYVGCSTFDGTYVTPSGAIAIGTAGTAQMADIKAFDPEPMPFMKIIATQTGSGTAGKDSKITAELIVQ